MHQTRTLALAIALVGGVAAVPLLPGALAALARPAPDAGGALGRYLDAPGLRPDVYVELFDLGELEQDLGASGLGRLMARFLAEDPPASTPAGSFGAQLAERFGIDAGALARGELSWEDTLALALYELGHEHLGLERREALRVAAALGERFSLALDVRGERAAASWSLREGGRQVLADTIERRLGPSRTGVRRVSLVEGGDGIESLPALVIEREQGGGADEGLCFELALEGLELRGADGRPGLFLVLRPDLAALSNDRAWARALASGQLVEATGGEADGANDLAPAREAALRAGAPVWARVDGRLLADLARGADAGAAFERLGLDTVRSLELSLGGRGGQLESRLRLALEPGERRGLFARLGAGLASWSAPLELLPADSFFVAGLAGGGGRGPAQVGRDLVELATAAAGLQALGGVWERLAGAPLLGELARAEDAAASEQQVLVVVRPGPAGFPVAYTLVPAGEALLARLEVLPASSGTADALAARPRQVDDAPCWVLSRGGREQALMHQDGALLGAQSLLALQDWARARRRAAAAPAGAGLSALAAELEAVAGTTVAGTKGTGGTRARRLAGFAHVQTTPLVEAVWPWVLMGLSLGGGGGAEGLEALPDAYELAEEIGDTTILVFDCGDAVELTGRGLFGGLGVLF